MFVKVLAAVLRFYSFVFHLTLSAFLLSLAGIAAHGQQTITIGMISLSDDGALRDTIIFGAFGLLCSLLALTRSFKLVFVLWTLIVFIVMTKTFFVGAYALQLPAEIRGAACLTSGAAGAFLGALWGVKTRRRQSLI